MRERVYAALTWESPDVVPWVPKSNHVPRNREVLRKLMEAGMGLSVPVNVFKVGTPNVTEETRVVGDHCLKTYITPVGSVSEMIRLNLPSEEGERSDRWVVDYVFKGAEDYRVVKFMVEDQVFEADYDAASQEEARLGDSAVAFTSCGYSPLMQLIVRFMGFKRFAFEVYRRREKVEEILEALDAKVTEACRVAADGPIKVVEVGDNIDGVMVSPDLFNRYCVPYYRGYNEVLRNKGKITMSHMDGRLKCLKTLIAETGFNAVEAFTPPPGGDLNLGEARHTWRGEVAVWVNVPEVMFYASTRGMERYIEALLREAAPGDGLVMGITETVPPTRRDAGLEAITRVIGRFGKLPVRTEREAAV